MAVRIGGKEIAAVYSAAVAAGRDGTEELRLFRAAIRELSHEEPDIGDIQIWPLGRINEEDSPFPMSEM